MNHYNNKNLTSKVKIAQIIEVRPENDPDVTLLFSPWSEPMMQAQPGQFIMLWLPYNPESELIDQTCDTVPMGISFCNEEIFGISVRAAGETTKALQKCQKGDLLGYIGPLGRGFEIKGAKIGIVAGGIGAAPLRLLAEHASQSGLQITALLAAKNKQELLFIKDYQDFCQRLILVTEDGSAGFKGLATDLLPELFKDGIDQLYVCGPEMMMYIILQEVLKQKIPAQFSLARHMHCGVGLCGSCMVDGYRVCKEGPVFTSEELKNCAEFGNIRRNECGLARKL